MTLRSTLRSQLRQNRNALTQAQQESAALNLFEQLKQNLDSPLTQLKANDKVALYLANDGEISPHHICNWLWQQNIDTYLPCINGETLVFAHYHDKCEWQKNQFNIAEPIDKKPLTGTEMQLVFMPLVGFDVLGGRLGMGGGYYDKTFASRKSHLVGLAHECQKVESLPIESWDVPLDAIATDSLYLKTNKI